MTITTDIKFHGNAKVLDDKLAFHPAINMKKGNYFAREGYSDFAHSEGKQYHPKYNKLTLGSQNMYLVKGSVTQYNYLEEPIDMTAVTQYADYLLENESGRYELELIDNRLEYKTRVDYSLTEWTDPPAIYNIECEKNMLEVQEDDSAFLCVIRLDEDYDAWIPKLRDVKAGESLTIEKEGEHCYVVFSSEVEKEGTNLEAFKMYKLSSDSMVITATEDTRIFRTYRD
jgi:hypothetical protein